MEFTIRCFAKAVSADIDRLPIVVNIEPSTTAISTMAVALVLSPYLALHALS